MCPGLQGDETPRYLCKCFFGSAREFGETPILGGFLKNDEFGLGDRHALSLEEKVAQVFVAMSSSEKGFDVAVASLPRPRSGL